MCVCVRTSCRERTWKRSSQPSVWSLDSTCCCWWPSPSLRAKSQSESSLCSATAPPAGRRYTLQIHTNQVLRALCVLLILHVLVIGHSFSCHDNSGVLPSQVSLYLEQAHNPALNLCPISNPHPHISAYRQGKLRLLWSSPGDTDLCDEIVGIIRLEFSTGLKITTKPNPARGFLNPNPTQPDTSAWIVCPNPTRTRPPASLHCFPHTLVIMIRQTADLLTLHHTWTAMIHNKQYIIYNLQEMCFIKKEARGPTWPAHLRTDPLRTLHQVNIRVIEHITNHFSQTMRSWWRPYRKMKRVNRVYDISAIDQ